MALPLVLKGISLGADRIPDKVFEAIPGGYFKAKEEQLEEIEREVTQKRKHHKRSSRRRSTRSRSFSPTHAPGFAGTDRDPPSDEYEHSEGSTSNVEEGYVPYAKYYPANNSAKENMAYNQRDNYGPRPYNPQDYAAAPSFRNGYYGEPQYPRNQEAYMPVSDPYRRPLSAGPDSRYNRGPRYDDPYRNGYNGNGKYNNSGEGYSDRGRHSERKHERKRRSKSRKESRSRSGSRGLTERFDLSGKGVGSAALGAIAGGFVGKEVGHSPFTALAGAVLGGLGANFFEKKHEQKKQEREKEGEGRKSGEHGDRYSRGYGSEGEYEDKAARRRRRRKEREAREEREEREESFKWGKIAQ